MDFIIRFLKRFHGTEHQVILVVANWTTSFLFHVPLPHSCFWDQFWNEPFPCRSLSEVLVSEESQLRYKPLLQVVTQRSPRGPDSFHPVAPNPWSSTLLLCIVRVGAAPVPHFIPKDGEERRRKRSIAHRFRGSNVETARIPYVYFSIAGFWFPQPLLQQRAGGLSRGWAAMCRIYRCWSCF